MKIAIGDIFYGAAVIYALYQIRHSVVPQEFIDKIKRYTSIKNDQMSLDGVMDVYQLSELEDTADRDFFKRHEQHITGEKRLDYEQVDKLL